MVAVGEGSIDKLPQRTGTKENEHEATAQAEDCLLESEVCAETGFALFAIRPADHA
jgi:hypothetical protein